MTRRIDRCAFLVLLATTVASTALAQSATGSFVLFANQSIRARGLDVSLGDVGANISITATKRLDAANSVIAAPFVDLHPASVCDEVHANGGQDAPACRITQHVTTPVIADVAAACGLTTPLPTSCPAGQAITVGHVRAPLVKGPGTYGAVMIAGGGHGPGTLVLTAGTYTFCSLKLGRNARLLARGAVTINVIGSIRQENGSTIGPESSGHACDVHVFAGGSVRISRKAHTTAILCAPHSKLELTVGAQLKGAFFANDVKSDRVKLTLEQCTAPPTTTSSSTTTSTSSPATTSSSSTSPGSTSSSTTSPEATSTTSTSSSTSSSTTTNTQCGNGVVDAGEDCDASSPTGAFNCQPGETCSADCTCVGATTSSTSTVATTSSTSTTETIPTTSSSTIIEVTTTSSSTGPTATTVPTTTSTSTIQTTTSTSTIQTTTSTSTIQTTTSTSTSSSTTTTIGTTFQPATAFDFLSTAGSGSCGNTFRDLAETTPLKTLICGNLSLGGGLSQVPDNTTPAGSTNRFSLSCNAQGQCTVGSVAASGAGFDCTNTGCRFGTPLPISNSGLSVCVENTYSQPASGTLDRNDGSATLNFQLNSRTILTGNPTQPCPICRIGTIAGNPCAGTPAAPCTGVCEGSPNQGSACVSTNPNGLTGSCPAPAAVTGSSKCYRGTNNGVQCTLSGDCPGGSCAQFVGDIPISLNPLTTGTSSQSSAAGTMCPGQLTNQKGAFKSDICQTGANSGKPCTAATAATACGAGIACRSGTLNNYCNGGTADGHGCVLSTDCGTGGVCTKAGTLAQVVRTTGSPAGLLQDTGTAHAVKLGSAFCVPATTNTAVNANANLPGPGATVLVGTIKLIP